VLLLGAGGCEAAAVLLLDAATAGVGARVRGAVLTCQMVGGSADAAGGSGQSATSGCQSGGSGLGSGVILPSGDGWPGGGPDAAALGGLGAEVMRLADLAVSGGAVGARTTQAGWWSLGEGLLVGGRLPPSAGVLQRRERMPGWRPRRNSCGLAWHGMALAAAWGAAVDVSCGGARREVLRCGLPQWWWWWVAACCRICSATASFADRRR
jgi:hypothetical protein